MCLIEVIRDRKKADMERSEIGDESVLEYVLFCIESPTGRLDKDGTEIYHILAEDSNILSIFICDKVGHFHLWLIHTSIFKIPY